MGSVKSVFPLQKKSQAFVKLRDSSTHPNIRGRKHTDLVADTIHARYSCVVTGFSNVQDKEQPLSWGGGTRGPHTHHM